jgi:hypothetical protein
MAEQIVPPVSTADLTEALLTLRGGNVQADLSLLQKFARADKAVIVAAIVHVCVLLVAYFKLKLSAEDIAVLGSMVSAGFGLLLQMHIGSVAKR